MDDKRKAEMKVLFIVPYPLNEAPSQRFRFAQYLGYLNESGIEFEVHSFLSDYAWKILYRPGHFFRKALLIKLGFLKRIGLMFRCSSFDFIFIHREAAPIGPPLFEFILVRLLQKKIIYDFDDAIWVKNYSESNRFFAFLKSHRNTETICRWAYKVSCGNDYLCQFAQQFNSNVVYNPTTIDTENYHNKIRHQTKDKFVIGWTGSHSTIKYLDGLVPVLAQLEKKYTFEFRVISDVKPDLALDSLVFVKWQKETEIDDLLEFSVGVMPLVHDQWSEGKCGFKALQYMALGIPALVSPVGVNTKIVDHGLNGFICQTNEDWLEKLEILMNDFELLQRISKETRAKIIRDYSVHSNRENFIKLFS
jgi:glycosyltransferase involved in cell wall biosynthesis